MARLEDYIDMSQYPNLTPEHRDALREMMHGATDENAPVWFQAHCTALFEMIAGGCERVEELIAEAKMQGVRGGLYQDDLMGRPMDDYED